MSKKDNPGVNMLLRKERLSRGWSQQDLANHLGITIVTVNRWERGTQQPSPLFRLKLCKIFDKDEMELGLRGEEDKTESASARALLQEQPHSSTFTTDLLPLQNDSSTAYTALPILPNTSTQDLPISRTKPLEESVQSNLVPFRQAKAPVQRSHIPLILYSLLVFTSLMFIATGLVMFLRNPSPLLLQRAISPQRAQTTISPSQPMASGSLLYQSQWSKDRGGWIASSHWHWSDQEGGMIVTDSMTNSIMLAPYQVGTSAYVIEATIQRLSYTALDGNAYGIVVGKTPANGAVCGIGNHEKPEHFFLGQLAASTTQSQPHILADVFRSPVTLDTQWHIYRVEITSAHIRFFFDKKLVGQANNDIHIQEGQIGIYAVGTFIRIKNFAVFGI